MRIVCLDTNILIYGVQQPSTLNPQFAADAEALLLQLTNEPAIILIPSIVLAEFLVGLEPETRQRAGQILPARFSIAPYDARAAQKYAEIWQGGRIEGRPRSAIVADKMIVATAIVHNADCVHSNDGDFRKIATDANLLTYEMPPAPPAQLRLLNPDVDSE